MKPFNDEELEAAADDDELECGGDHDHDLELVEVQLTIGEELARRFQALDPATRRRRLDRLMAAAHLERPPPRRGVRRP